MKEALFNIGITWRFTWKRPPLKLDLSISFIRFFFSRKTPGLNDHRFMNDHRF